MFKLLILLLISVVVLVNSHHDYDYEDSEKKTEHNYEDHEKLKKKIVGDHKYYKDSEKDEDHDDRYELPAVNVPSSKNYEDSDKKTEYKYEQHDKLKKKMDENQKYYDKDNQKDEENDNDRYQLPAVNKNVPSSKLRLLKPKMQEENIQRQGNGNNGNNGNSRINLSRSGVVRRGNGETTFATPNPIRDIFENTKQGQGQGSDFGPRLQDGLRGLAKDEESNEQQDKGRHRPLEDIFPVQIQPEKSRPVEPKQIIIYVKNYTPLQETLVDEYIKKTN